jgi:arsenate reductase-like glutaredoxin family protein
MTEMWQIPALTRYSRPPKNHDHALHEATVNRYTQWVEVQIFGLKASSETRAAERFFKERRIKIHFVDLAERPISPGEIGRFVQKFGLNALLDLEGKSYRDAGLEHMRVSDASMLTRIAREPRLLRLPLVRSGKFLSLGRAETEWKTWLEAEKS